MPQRVDLFLALKGRIEQDIVKYTDAQAGSTQIARVIGRIEGYEQVLKWIAELLTVDVVE